MLLRELGGICSMLREGAVRPPAPERPPFPPATVRLQPAFPAELGNELGPEVLMLWSFLHSFGDILGLSPASVDEVLAAVALGDRRYAIADPVWQFWTQAHLT